MASVVVKRSYVQSISQDVYTTTFLMHINAEINMLSAEIELTLIIASLLLVYFGLPNENIP